MKTILTILGARPQFIKAAPLSRLLKDDPSIQENILHTGQHFDAHMSDIFFRELEIPQPAYQLKIEGRTHGQMTASMLSQIEAILLQDRPDAVIVYGDTNSTLAGALAAVKLHIPLIHIEAGLRSYNNAMPEEINRILTDRISTLFLCPTTRAVNNLAAEGLKENVHHVGDTMYDATLFALDKIKQNPDIAQNFPFIDHPFVLLTLHRQDATASFDAFNARFDYALDFARQANMDLVFPVHPRTQPFVQGREGKRVFFLGPLGYFEMHALLSRAKTVLTDSGGLQKEAYFHRVPCITLRSETEWVETVEAGWNRLWTEADFILPRREIIEYGQGDAARGIRHLLQNVS